ncbi:MAG: hypothetical protein CMJ83_21135 [Planctomycetes bacterium]|nr:hypothetical protein [Planctomycetota bacterium]
MSQLNTAVLLICVALTTGCETTVERGLPPTTTQEERAAKLFEEGRIVESRALFLQAAQINQRPFWSSIGLARCGIARAKWPEVNVAFRQAYASAPKTPEANDLLGRTHLEAAKVATGGVRLQHATTAATLLSAASRQAPEIPGLAYHTGLAELLSNRARNAIPLLEAAIAKDPDDELALQALVVTWKHLGQHREVLQILEPLERDGRLPVALVPELVWARQALPKR